MTGPSTSDDVCTTRYDEPILLALGLVGHEHVDDLDELFTIALLAESDEAHDLGFTPTMHEDLLGRDFRFTLRALADDIPAKPRLVDALLNRSLNELLNATGRGRFAPYREAVLERLRALSRFPPAHASLRCWRSGFRSSRWATTSAVIDRLLELTATPGGSYLAIRAAQVLTGQAELPDAVIDRLSPLASDGLSAAYVALWRPWTGWAIWKRALVGGSKRPRRSGPTPRCQAARDAVCGAQVRSPASAARHQIERADPSTVEARNRRA